MARPVTLFTGQWADLPLVELAEKAKGWGYEGLELACWGDHMDVDKATSPGGRTYCKAQLAMLKKAGLDCWAISHHLAGQFVCDLNNDKRSDGFAPPACAGNPEKKRQWAIETMKKTALAARMMGVKVVNGFTGSSIWHLLYSFPPVSEAEIEAGFDYFIEMFGPIMAEFARCKVRFALEVHPTEIAYDLYTARRLIDKIEQSVKQGKWTREMADAFGFNLDPSHLHWQVVDPVKFLQEFPGRIYHVHMKDVALQLDGKSSILASHLNFGKPGRGWDFRSLGHGGVNFEEIIRQLNTMGYGGPLSVEWEDCGMEREFGAREAAAFVHKINFAPSNVQFDAAFDK